MNITKNALVIIIFFVGGAIGFFGGMTYQKHQTPQLPRQAGAPGAPGTGRQGQGGRFGQGGFRPVNGEILSQDEKSVTVKLQDGSSKIVLLTDTTTFNKSSEGSKSDLKVGDRVAVFGSDNSDGSVTAQQVQLNPTFGGRGDRPTGL